MTASAPNRDKAELKQELRPHRLARSQLAWGLLAIAIMLLVVNGGMVFWPPARAVAPFDEESAHRFVGNWSEHLARPAAMPNGVGMRMCLIPPGSFMMGSKPDEAEVNRKIREGPPHEVAITRPFYIAAHEVTLEQFRAFVSASGYSAHRTSTSSLDGPDETTPEPWENALFSQTSSHPVTCVSWNDAVAFCEWLSEEEGKRYRLPTEAEWEYACRAGSQLPFAFGYSLWRFRPMANHADVALLNDSSGLKETAAPWNDGFAFSAPVGSFEPNAFGLCDMHGNIREWCQDYFDPTYFLEGPSRDPRGGANGRTRILRGGSWGSQESYCRSARRFDDRPETRENRNGFRVVCEIGDE